MHPLPRQGAIEYLWSNLAFKKTVIACAWPVARHQDPWKALAKTREGLKEREDQTKSTAHRREEAERREKTSQKRYNPLHNGFLVQFN